MEENFTSSSKLFDKNELGSFIPTPSMTKENKKLSAIRGVLYLCILLSILTNNMSYILIFIVLYFVINNISQEYYNGESIFMGHNTTSGLPSESELPLITSNGTLLGTTTKIPNTKDSILGVHTLESNFDENFYNNLLSLKDSNNVINSNFKYINRDETCIKPNINSPYMNELPLSDNKYPQSQPCLPDKNIKEKISELTDDYISSTDIYTPDFKNLSFNTVPNRNSENEKQFNDFLYNDMNPKGCIKDTFACQGMGI